MLTKIILSSLLLVTVAEAQMDMAFRRANAIALYEFADISGSIIKDTSSLGTPLDLIIADPSAGAIQRGSGYIDIQTRNLISSSGPATKIIDACKLSGEMTIETWVENNDPAQLSVGKYPGGTDQANRIVSLSSNLLKNNFYVGQFYDNAELYYAAVNTSGNEKQSEPGGSLNNPLVSTKNQIIIPALEINNPPAVKMQKIIMTLNKDAVARFYLSDRDGNISKAAMTATGFSKGSAAYFANWYTDAKLTLGNVSTTFNEVKNATGDFTKCDDAKSIDAYPSCSANSRYWKGRISLVAIYCKALTDADIVGNRSNSQITNKVIPIDANVVVTENLKKAQEIFQRLTGVKTPIYDPILAEMEKKIVANDLIGAAAMATNDSRFYNITVRDFASKMSNRSETINTPLNDFTATVIGSVRDEINAQRLLWDNLVYVADPTKASVPSSSVADLLRSNNHYESLDTQRIDLAKVLIPAKQKIFDGSKSLDMPTPSGLLTTRQWLSAHAIAGTNRRLVEFSFREFLCTPLEKVADSTGPDNVVGRDIDRFPGGSHTKFTTTCRACHTIMDGFRPAFGYFTFNNDYVMHSFTSPTVKTQVDEDNGLGMFKTAEAGATYVHDKLNHNSTVFPGGRITVDDNWVNNAVYGVNLPYFNWKRMSGKGIQDFGKMLSESKQFPLCMANRVYTSVCKRAPSSSEDAMLSAAATEFSTKRNYNLKFLFQKIVTSKECLGGN
ncbi:MAG: hypothetical protein WA160_14005 [Pseudobdellovibrio sp.]